MKFFSFLAIDRKILRLSIGSIQLKLKLSKSFYYILLLVICLLFKFFSFSQNSLDASKS